MNLLAIEHTHNIPHHTIKAYRMRSVKFLRIGYLRTKAQPVNASRLLHESAIYGYIASCFICETRRLC